MNEALWNQVIALGKRDNRSKGVANTLDDDDLNTILATMDFFGADMRDLQQTYFDLKVARYRVFDWLGMCIMGRIDSRISVKVLVHALLKVDGDVTAFIEDLRYTDYDIDHAWESIDPDGGE